MSRKKKNAGFEVTGDALGSNPSDSVGNGEGEGDGENVEVLSDGKSSRVLRLLNLMKYILVPSSITSLSPHCNGPSTTPSRKSVMLSSEGEKMLSKWIGLPEH